MTRVQNNQQSQDPAQSIGMWCNGSAAGFEPARLSPILSVPANFYNDNIEYFDDF